MPTDQPGLRLDQRSLAHLRGAITLPGYAREGLRRSIVHIGVGGFHRAHLATYVDELCESGHRDWSIVGAGVLPGDEAMADVLGRQDCLYTLLTRGPAEASVQVIGSLVDYVHAWPDPEPLIAAIADPATQIVSLTVTEGGYPVDDVTGAYIAESPNAGPSSAFGIVAAGLRRRREANGAGLTVISCDNIISNGRAARNATLGEARHLNDDLATWIDESITFPNCMVDRITPATTDADRAWLAETAGLLDGWPVVTEPFRQWVIEDRFGGDRLPLEELDVLVTDDVEPYELMKLRLLNAAHSCLAYLAAIEGIETVDAALADPGLRRFMATFLEQEARPVLPPITGIDLDQYIASIIERFANPNIRDQIARLCLDGSAKFPKFLLPTVRAQVQAGGPVELSALALAGWCEYLATAPEPAGDPLLAAAVGHARDARHDPAAFLAFAEVFGDDLPQAPRFTEAFSEALRLIRERGVRSAIDTTLGEAERFDGTGD